MYPITEYVVFKGKDAVAHCGFNYAEAIARARELKHGYISYTAKPRKPAAPIKPATKTWRQILAA